MTEIFAVNVYLEYQVSSHIEQLRRKRFLADLGCVKCHLKKPFSSWVRLKERADSHKPLY